MSATLRGSDWPRDIPQYDSGDRWPERRGDTDTQSDEDILQEARDRFTQITDWEADFRSLFVDDLQFVNGDADNHWQWPDEYYGPRSDENRPALTVNKTRQHCLQIINDARQNKPQIRINPVSDEATKEAADVYESVVRHIEYLSNASVAYDTATEHQVQGGIGWWRVVTDYESEDSFDQEIYIRRIKDPLSIYMDPDIQELDGSDARYAFIVDDVPRDQFEDKYPGYRKYLPTSAGIGTNHIDGGWLDEDHVRVAEYYRKSEVQDTLHLMRDGSTIKESDVAELGIKTQVRQQSIKQRQITLNVVEWFKIVGGEIIERGEWPGRYIPLVRVIGEETIIEGRLERKGHARALKDPQRIYNYWTSSGVEAVALQTKTPWLAAVESIENFQDKWDSANIENHSVLPWNAINEQGQPNPPPARVDPPQMPQAYIQGLQIAQNEMMLVSGQYQPTMGGAANPSEISGKAIALRQRQGDNATYHYIDNLATAIRFTGRIMIDLIPRIYDTPRIMRITQVDGSVERVRLDPSAPQALTNMQAPNVPQQISPLPSPQQQMQQAVTRIFNPRVGKYEVQADIGPAYATRRQEAYNAFIQILQSAPQLMTVMGDLAFKAADFPMAEEVAERLQRMVPPQALGMGPSPQEQALAQQNQALQAHLQLISERLSTAQQHLHAREERQSINAYEAVTKRLGTLLSSKDTDSAYATANELRILIGQMVNDAIRMGGMATVEASAQQGMLNAAAIGAPLRTGQVPGGPAPSPSVVSGLANLTSPVNPAGVGRGTPP